MTNIVQLCNSLRHEIQININHSACQQKGKSVGPTATTSLSEDLDLSSDRDILMLIVISYGGEDEGYFKKFTVAVD